MKIIKGIFGLIGVLVVISMVVSFMGSSSSPSLDPANEIPVSAQQIAAAYEANEVAADDVYKGKTLLISGYIHNIGKDITDTPYVTLRTGNPYAIVGVPQLFFADEYQDRLAAFRQGEPITALCLGRGKFGNVLLKDCEIVSPSAGATR